MATGPDGSERGDVSIVRHLQERGYHPRSSKHGDALCRFLLRDLLYECPSFREAAHAGTICFRSNFTIDPDSADRWNADLVIGPPPSGFQSTEAEMLAEVDPERIWVAVDARPS